MRTAVGQIAGGYYFLCIVQQCATDLSAQNGNQVYMYFFTHRYLVLEFEDAAHMQNRLQLVARLDGVDARTRDRLHVRPTDG